MSQHFLVLDRHTLVHTLVFTAVPAYGFILGLCTIAIIDSLDTFETLVDDDFLDRLQSFLCNATIGSK